MHRRCKITYFGAYNANRWLVIKIFTYNLHKINIKLYLWTVCLKKA